MDGQSPKFSLNSVDFKALGWNALKVALGAVATYALQELTKVEWPAQYQVLATALIAGATDLLHKYFAGPSK